MTDTKNCNGISYDRFDAFLTVIIPAYNEADRIRETLSVVSSSIARLSDSFEIIVVNDGSSDKTFEQILLAQQQDAHIRCVNCEENVGKGNALKTGVQDASDEGYIAFLDADLDLHPDHLQNFYRLMQEQCADVVIGSKMHPDSLLDYPKSRRRISACYYFILRLLFGLNIHDTQTGVKLFRAEAIKDVMPLILVKRFAYDIELLALLNQAKACIVEAPIELQFRRGQAWGRIRVKDMWQTGWDTLAVFYRLRILKYYDRVRRASNISNNNRQ
jgi:glycosyltransferase involved in cell wall biosynthesis